MVCVRQFRSVNREVACPGTGEVLVFALDIDAIDPASCWSVLDPMEVARAQRLVRESDRRTFVVTRAKLRHVLGSITSIDPVQFRFDVGNWGKPFIAIPELSFDFDFSVAHSQGRALIAVARGRRIGVDLERQRYVDDWSKIAASTFGAAWAERLSALDDDRRVKLFLRCWTVAEAYAKATGLGLAGLGGVIRLKPGTAGPDDVALADDTLAHSDREWTTTNLDLGTEYVASMVLDTESARPAIVARSSFHEPLPAL